MLKKKLTRLYADFITLIAPFYRFFYKTFCKVQRGYPQRRIVLLISRPHDVELLIGLYGKAQADRNLSPTFWVVNKCVRRYPNVLTVLREKNANIEMVVSINHLGKILNKLMWTDIFLSTVESTGARRKLPYIITRLANALGLSTYTIQHGFENPGLTYCKNIHGPNVRFSAKTLLTWGPTEELPAWVSSDTRDKAIAVGCPKTLFVKENASPVKAGARPIIGVFDNLHWDRYDKAYVALFLNHLDETARQQQEFRFVLKSHPLSVRRRSKELTARLISMENVDVVDLLEREEPALTTPWLLAHALGVITTPSTIALDCTLANTPVAVTRYGLDLSYYYPLSLLDSADDWLKFLDHLTEKSSYNQLIQNGGHFRSRVLIPGDPAAKILKLMTS